MNVYWYAPFDNAGEVALSAEVSRSDGIDLSVQSISERFGRQLDPLPSGDFTLIRNLPPPAIERRSRNNPGDRAWTALERSAKRRRIVRRNGFDLLHLHTFNPLTDWIAIERLQRFTPTIIQSVHNVRPHESSYPKRLETMLLRRGYAACTAIVVAHADLRDLLVNEMDVPSQRVHIIPLVTMPVRAANFRERSQSDQINFLFFGTLRKTKGVTTLIEAIRALASDERLARRIRFTIAGRGDSELEQLVATSARDLNNLSAEIGYITAERRQQLYDAADCVLLPYTSISAQSGVLQDAYSQRLPVIASAVGPIGQTVKAFGSGWVIPPSDPAALEQAIVAAASSSENRRSAGEQGANIAERRSPSVIADQLIALYEEVHAGRH